MPSNHSTTGHADDAPPRAYDELGELYDEWCAGVVEDVPFYRSIAQALTMEVDRPLDVVELGAGSGRVSVPLALDGCRVHAIDTSQTLLRRLEQRAAGAGVDHVITTTHGDMRDLSRLAEPETSDLVIAPFRALLHATAARDVVLSAARSVLRPGGVIAFDVFHPGLDTCADMDGSWLARRSTRTASGRWWFEERATCAADANSEDEVPAHRIELEVRCRWVATAGRRDRRRHADRHVSEPAPGEPHERLVRMSLVSVPAHAWLTSITRAGLEIDGAYGWFDGRPLAPGDDDSAWVARRPAS